MSENTVNQIRKARFKLCSELPFFGYLALRLDLVEKADLDAPMGVNMNNELLYNPKRLEGFELEDYATVLLHEVLHPTMHVFSRLGGRDPMLWNIAHDYAINLIIEELAENSRLIKSVTRVKAPGLLDMKYTGMCAEEIYEDLVPDFGARTLTGFGDVDFSPPSDDGDNDSEADGEGQSPGMTPQQRVRAYESDWCIALAEAWLYEQKRQGSLSGFAQKIKAELTDPQIEWHEVLSQWIGENGNRRDYTYGKLSRKLRRPTSMRLPGVRRNGYADVTVLLDTSGSMLKEAPQILTETLAICEDLNLAVRVLVVDTEIRADVSDVTAWEDLEEHVQGGGGSDFRPAFNLLETEGDTTLVVAFTDGFIRVPDMMPEQIRSCLWVLTPEGTDPTGGRWGHVLKLPEAGG